MRLFTSRRQKLDKLFKNITRDVNPNNVWEVQGDLGEGSFGMVHKVYNKETQVTAAAKVVPVENQEELTDFVIEVDILTACAHKNIVGLVGAYYDNSKLWILMELCDGGAVDDILLDLEDGLREDQIRPMARQITEGLAFLHEKGVIHRDMKAGNVLLAADGTVKLTDFGVSAMMKSPNDKRDTFIGTPYWMAPEVIICENIRDRPYTNMCDIWSFGITLLEIAEQNPPYHDMHPMRVLFKIPKSPAPKFQFPDNWSSAFNDFLSKCCQKNPNDRWPASRLLEHEFIRDATDNRAIRDLIRLTNADVVEVLEDLPQEEQAKMQDKSVSDMEKFAENARISADLSTDTDDASSTADEGLSEAGATTVPEQSHQQQQDAAEVVEPVGDDLDDIDLADFGFHTGPTTVLEPVSDDTAQQSEQKPSDTTREESDLDVKQPQQEPAAAITLDDSPLAASASASAAAPEEAEAATHAETADEKRPPTEERIRPSISISQRFDEAGPVDEDAPSRGMKRQSSVELDLLGATDTDSPLAPKISVNGAMLAEAQTDELSKSSSSQTEKTAANGDDDDRVKYKTLTRTRTYVNEEGETVTVTTSKVVETSQASGKTLKKRGERNHFQDWDADANKQFALLKRQQLREMRLIQREEHSECANLVAKLNSERQTNDAKQRKDMGDLGKDFERKIAAQQKSAKSDIERLDKQQLQLAASTIRDRQSQQSKDRKRFRAELASEVKDKKQEINAMPKAERKTTGKEQLQQLEAEHTTRYADFKRQQEHEYEMFLIELNEKLTTDMLEAELMLMKREHNMWLERADAMADLGERQMMERQQMLKHQLKATFLMQKHQMQYRHDKEIEQLEVYHNMKLHHLDRKYDRDLKALPKKHKLESLVRKKEFKRNLSNEASKADQRSQLEEFKSSEAKLLRSAQSRLESAYKSARESLERAMKRDLDELRKLQASKKQDLEKNEEGKLKDLGKRHVFELKQFRSRIEEGRAKLVRECDDQLEHHRREAQNRPDILAKLGRSRTASNLSQTSFAHLKAANSSRLDNSSSADS